MTLNWTPKSLSELLSSRAADSPHAPAFSLLNDMGDVTLTLTYGELDQRARAVAQNLTESGFAGDRVVLAYRTGLEFVVALYGVLYAGGVAIPTVIPGVERTARSYARFQGIVNAVTPRAVLTTENAAPMLATACSGLSVPAPPVVTTDAWSAASVARYSIPEKRDADLAIVQFTSGTTGTPKGVTLRNRQVIANLKMIEEAYRDALAPVRAANHQLVTVCWLPFSHDMGLVGGILMTPYLGSHCLLMSQVRFTRAPLDWIRAISRHRAHYTACPNFALEMCARAAASGVPEGLDLSDWRVAIVGAEMVRPATLERFYAALSRFGLRGSAIHPAYGLAEAVLAVSSGVWHASAHVREFDARALSEDVAVAPAAGPVRVLVSSGKPLDGVRVDIVDTATGETCSPGRVGEVWLKGESVMSGYWAGCAEGVRSTESGGAFATGDLGFMLDGELFISGRRADTIVIRGRNIQPEDIEAAASECHWALRKGAVAAFAADQGLKEELVVAVEFDQSLVQSDVEARRSVLAELSDQVRNCVAQKVGIVAKAVLVLRPHKLPRTPSGKVQRGILKADYSSGLLCTAYESNAPSAENIGETLRRLLALKHAHPQGTRVGADDLMDANLDSLTRVEVQHVIEEMYGIVISTSAASGARSAREMLTVAEAIVEKASPSGTAVESRELLTARGPGSRASEGERGLWLAHVGAANPDALNIQLSATLEPSLDLSCVKRALERVIDANPSLRATYRFADDALVRLETPRAPDAVIVEEVSRGSARDAHWYASRESRRAVDLERGPVARARIFRFAGGRPLLTITVHHIAADLWSLEVIVEQLDDEYRRLRSGAFGERIVRATSLPPSRIVGAPEGRRHELLAYWSRTLGGFRPRRLFSRTRLTSPSSRGDDNQVELRVDDFSASAVRALAHDLNTTPFAVLLTALQVLLYRMTDCADVAVGTSVNGRDHAHTARVVGYLANTLVIRTSLGAQDSFRESVRRVAASLQGALAHQELSFADLVESLLPDRMDGDNPFFEVMFTYLKPRHKGLSPFIRGVCGGSVKLRGLSSIESVRCRRVDTQFPITLNVIDDDGKFDAVLYFNHSTVSRAAAVAFGERYTKLLSDVLRWAETPIQTIDATQIRGRRLHTQSDGGPRMGRSSNRLHDLIRQQADSAPERVALVADDIEISYRDLMSRVQGLANRLAASGIGAHDRVAVCLPRSVDLVVSLLAILQVGAAYVPIEPSDPETRRAALVEDAGAIATIAQDRSGVRADALAIVLSQAGRASHAGACDPNDVAYIIATSGSTGAPKAAMNTHAAVVNRLLWQIRELGIGADDRILHKTPYTFDVSVWEIFIPLIVGATMVIARPDGHRDPMYLRNLVSAQRVTIAHFVPSMLELFIDVETEPSETTLRAVVASGEALPVATVDQFFKTLPGTSLYNLYGPTETAIDVTSWRCVPGRQQSSIPIGNPIAGCAIYVLDDEWRPVDPDVVGEIYIAGAAVGLGYVNRGAATAAAFLPDPFAEESGVRMYRSGDYGRWTSEGTLEFFGRRDRQLKIRGVRIELGEIEAVLRSYDAVRDAIVIPITREGEVTLVAYAVFHRRAESSTEALTAFARSRLPSALVPTTIVEIDAFPLTPNGKLDTAALAQRIPVGGTARNEEVRTPLQQRVFDAFAAVLGDGALRSIDDDFFAVGGHSLMAVRVLARLNLGAQRTLGVHDVFSARTARRLAALIDALPPLPTSGLGPTKAEMPRASHPLSAAQRQLWFLDQLDGSSALYNVVVRARFSSPLSALHLKRALLTVVRRHESLRTTFHASGGVPYARIDTEARALEWYEGAVSVAPADDEPPPQLTERPFDLKAGPLLRAALLTRAEEGCELVVATHHIVADGWSLGILLSEIATLYESYESGKPATLRPLPIQFADHAEWEGSEHYGEVIRSDMTYWRKQLAGAKHGVTWPLDYPRRGRESHRGRVHAFTVPSHLANALSLLSRERGVTLYMTMLAAFMALLGKDADTEDVTVGSPIANRRYRQCEPLIGMFVNTVVIRVDLSGDPTFSEVLQRVKESTLDAHAHGAAPFQRVVEELAPPRDLGRTPLFLVSFALQNVPLPAMRVGGVEAKAEVLSNGTSKFDLALSVVETTSGLKATVEYATDLFRPETVKAICSRYHALLERVVASPDEALAALVAGDRNDGTTASAAISDPRPTYRPIHELIDLVAESCPEATAVRAGDESVTYGQLAKAADALASRLVREGVRPDECVGVCGGRSIEVIIAFLAILKAGAAYVYLDPNVTSARLQSQARLARVRVCVVAADVSSALRGRLAEASLTIRPVMTAEDPHGGTRIATAKCDPESLAYVMFTSGSTGAPKGVMVTHRGLFSYVTWARETYGSSSGTGGLLHTSLGVDLTVTSLWVPLVAGGCVSIVPEELGAGALVHGLMNTQSVGILKCTPSHLRLLSDASAKCIEKCAAVVIGGEELRWEQVAWLRNVAPSIRIVNEYGPTETVVGSCAYEVDEVVATGRVPIGEAIIGTQLYLLDDAMSPVPQGRDGELYIGGEAVARGYVGCAALTARSFVPDPYSYGGRLYRTGDVCRALADGALEFRGRVDNQVKVRGHRVELDEVSEAVRACPGVRDAVVVQRDDGRDGKRLIAYVESGLTHASGEAASVEAALHVAEWGSLYEAIYAKEDEADPLFDLAGWTSSYTGAAIPAPAMKAWVTNTVEVVLAQCPARVLEMGAGTGLIAGRIAPHVKAYHAADFSPTVVERVRRRLPAVLPMANLAFSVREANDFRGFKRDEFDTIILNSVVQYLPDANYITEILRGALSVTSRGGRIFVGDVRHLEFLEAFHTDVGVARARPSTTVRELRANVTNAVVQSRELAVHPHYFYDAMARLGRSARIEVLPKRRSSDLELDAFRYDVLIHLDATIEASVGSAGRSFASVGGDVVRVARVLRDERPPSYVITAVPNRRLERIISMWKSSLVADPELRVSDWLRRTSVVERGVPPEYWAGLAREWGYAAAVSWATGADDGSYDVALLRADIGDESLASKLLASPKPLGLRREGGNTPVAARVARRVEDGWRRSLVDRLPEYMIPSALVVLPRLPRTQSGKVDRRALPEPPLPRDFHGAREPAASLTEELISSIWEDVLQVRGVPRDVSFFDLGGHSLLATQVIARITRVFEVEIPLAKIFTAPTVASLSAHVDALRARGLARAPEPPLSEADRPARVPLSMAQQRLWILDQLEASSAAYNMGCAVRIRGALDVTALEKSIRQLVARHESLRTTFATGGALPYQDVSEDVRLEWSDADLRELGVAAEAESRQEAVQLQHRVFDLCKGPLIRARLMRVRDDEYLLSVSMHHIVSDGWSLSVAVHDIGEFYRAAVGQTPASLPALPIQYADFAAWQRRVLTGSQLSALRAYWVEKLRGAPTALELAGQKPRPLHQGFRAVRNQIVVEQALAEALRRVSREHNVTLFMTMLAGFSVVLGRHAARNDIVVGVPMSGRNRPELERLIGFFVNIVPHRVELAGNPTFAELLARVRSTSVDAHAHQEFPFEAIVDAIGPERDLSRTPVVQVTFAMDNMPAPNFQWAGLDAEAVDIFGGIGKFDLSVSVAEVNNALCIQWDFNPELFDGGTVGTWGDQYVALLRCVVADASRRVDDAESISDAERARKRAWNETEVSYPVNESLFELVARSVCLYPMAAAITCGGKSVSYVELDATMQLMASALRERGVDEGQRVGLMVERGADMVAAMLAVWMCGGTVVPIDPEYPDERVHWTLGASQLSALILDRTTCRWRAKYPQLAILCEDMVDEAEDADASIRVMPSRGRSAYIIYTSGTSGTPKGVEISQRSLVNCLRSMASRPGMGTNDCMLALTSVSFDISMLELFLPLTVGASVVIATRDEVQDPVRLAGHLRDPRITIVQGTPTLMKLLVPERWDGKGRLTILVGGERLSDALAAQLLSRAERVWNMYGPTETTIWSCIHEVSLEDTSAIGRPIANTRVRVVDDVGRDVPVGVRGEIWIGGDGLAIGYWSDDALTRAKFMKDVNGSAWYRTGDVGRFRHDGVLEFHGRNDEQIKYNGFRIEPTEIEDVLLRRRDLRDAAVVPIADEHGATALTAFVVRATAGEVPTSEDLTAYVMEWLPRYMVPRRFVSMEWLPRLPNGKSDRAALARVVPTVSEPICAEQVVSDDGESAVLKCWATALARPNLSRDDNFFAVGGDSIRAIQCVSLLRREGFSCDVRHVFRYQTPKSFAAAIKRDEVSGVGSAADSDAASAREEVGDYAYPLVPMQSAMVIQSMRARGRYVQQVTFVVGGVDGQGIQSAWKKLEQRYAVLRTSFQFQADGTPIQAVSPCAPAPFLEEDWSDVDISSRARMLSQFLLEDREIAFDLSVPPLVRFAQIAVAPRTYRVVLSFHHALLDGWSVAILLSEWREEYLALARGKQRDSLPAPSYRRYVEWVVSRDPAQSEEFWRYHLGTWKFGPNRSPETLPAHEYGTRIVRSRSLNAALVARVKTAARTAEVTAAVVMVAAWGLMLARDSASDSAVFGIIDSGRSVDVAGVEEMAGLLINCVPARVECPRNETCVTWLRRQHAMRELEREHACIGLGRIKKAIGIPSDCILWDRVLVVANYPLVEEYAARPADGFELHEFDVLESTEFALTMTVSVGDAMKLTAVGAADEWSDEALNALLERYERFILTVASLDVCNSDLERELSEIG